MKLAPHPYTLRQLQYAVAVFEELSFRRAAERCNVSQPSLSAALAQLEEALGVQLFERDRRGVLPTGAGRDLVTRRTSPKVVRLQRRTQGVEENQPEGRAPATENPGRTRPRRTHPPAENPPGRTHPKVVRLQHVNA